MKSLTKPESIFYPELSYAVTGLLYKVQNQLGLYCSEKQYADRLEQLLIQEKITYQREFNLPVTFESSKPIRNRVDFLIDDKLIIELKACRIITTQEYSQTLRYLQASHKKLAILVNFHSKYLQPKRIINSKVTA